MAEPALPLIEELTGIDTYTKWVFRRWLLVLSSGEVAAVLLFWFFIGPSITNLVPLILVYVLFFAVQVYVATYKFWEAERKDKISIVESLQAKETQIDKISIEKDYFETEARQLQLSLRERAQDRKPRLMGSATNINWLPIMDATGKDFLGTRFLIFLGITNASPVPTTISRFILDINQNDSHHIGYAGERFGEFGVLQQECFNVYAGRLRDEENLARVFGAGKKAELGERNSGWLFFDFETIRDLDTETDWSKNMTLQLVDAFDERHTIEGGVLKKKYESAG